MSSWDAEQGRIVRWKPQPWHGYPGWRSVDCGCCNGIEWSGESPVECRTCGGGGHLAMHIESGKLAHWPGGPFCGVASVWEIAEGRALAKMGVSNDL